MPLAHLKTSILQTKVELQIKYAYKHFGMKIVILCLYQNWKWDFYGDFQTLCNNIEKMGLATYREKTCHPFRKTKDTYTRVMSLS